MEKKKLGLSGKSKLELSKTVGSGTVKQSISHGRVKSVAVEVKKIRTFRKNNDDVNKLNEDSLEDKKADSIVVESEFGQFLINQSIDKSTGDSLTFGIRPEEIKILNQNNSNSIEVIIKDLEFRGSTSNLNVKSRHSEKYLKIQNISSNISQSFQQGDVINVELNTGVGTIFKDETIS
jgi:ABC-type sulfate/molybdate transport systems ATPase subunit